MIRVVISIAREIIGEESLRLCNDAQRLVEKTDEQTAARSESVRMKSIERGEAPSHIRVAE